MFFTLLIMFFDTLFINNIDIKEWFNNPDDGNILTLSFSLLLFIVMAGITVRYLKKPGFQSNTRKNKKIYTELENLVDKRAGELKNVVKEMEEFSFGLSYDFKSPIIAIDDYSLMLLEDNPLIDQKSREMIESIKKHCAEMIKLIDKILEYSVLTNKRLNLSK